MNREELCFRTPGFAVEGRMQEVGEGSLIKAGCGISDFWDPPTEGGSQNVEIRRKDKVGSGISSPRNLSAEGERPEVEN